MSTKNFAGSRAASLPGRAAVGNSRAETFKEFRAGLQFIEASLHRAKPSSRFSRALHLGQIDRRQQPLGGGQLGDQKICVSRCSVMALPMALRTVGELLGTQM